MKVRLPVAARAWRAAVVLVAMPLAGCGGGAYSPPPGIPSLYRSMATADAKVDAAAAASMISGYRHNNGLGAVTTNSTLMRMAAAQARAMAARNKLEHNVGGSFAKRLHASGYDARVAAENIGAGYHTLAEAFSGWRDSPHHRANMLLRDASQIGIAAAYAPHSKYKVFWSLVLAAPDTPHPHPAVRSSSTCRGLCGPGASEARSFGLRIR